jgi:protein SCO1/2
MTGRAHAKASTLAVCALAGALVFGLQSGAAAERLDPSKALQRSEAAIGRMLGAYTLMDSTGAPLSLRAFRGKPLVISLVYTACSSVCPTSTQHLITAVTDARRVLGSDHFNVLTVGFDARNDTPSRLTLRRREYPAPDGDSRARMRRRSRRCCAISASATRPSPAASIT